MDVLLGLELHEVLEARLVLLLILGDALDLVCNCQELVHHRSLLALQLTRGHLKSRDECKNSQQTTHVRYPLLVDLHLSLLWRGGYNRQMQMNLLRLWRGGGSIGLGLKPVQFGLGVTEELVIVQVDNGGVDRWGNGGRRGKGSGSGSWSNGHRQAEHGRWLLSSRREAR